MRRPDPDIEAKKIASAAAFFEKTCTEMNGHPPTEEQIAIASKKMARGLPPFWDWRTKKYL
jgi:hypothetical protein